MKAGHLMTPTERREWLETRLENARFLAKMYSDRTRWQPQDKTLAEGWEREAKRLKEILK